MSLPFQAGLKKKNDLLCRIFHGIKTKKAVSAITFYLFEQINEIIYYIFWGHQEVVKRIHSLKLGRLGF